MTVDETMVERYGFDRAAFFAALRAGITASGWMTGVSAGEGKPDLPRLIAVLATTSSVVLGLGPIPAAVARLLPNPTAKQKAAADRLTPMAALCDVLFWARSRGRFLIQTHSVGVAFAAQDIRDDIRRYCRYAERLYSWTGEMLPHSGGNPWISAHYWFVDNGAGEATVEEIGAQKLEVTEPLGSKRSSVVVEVRLNPLTSGANAEQKVTDLLRFARHVYAHRSD